MCSTSNTFKLQLFQHPTTKTNKPFKHQHVRRNTTTPHTQQQLIKFKTQSFQKTKKIPLKIDCRPYLAMPRVPISSRRAWSINGLQLMNLQISLNFKVKKKVPSQKLLPIIRWMISDIYKWLFELAKQAIKPSDLQLAQAAWNGSTKHLVTWSRGCNILDKKVQNIVIFSTKVWFCTATLWTRLPRCLLRGNFG